MPVPDVVAPTVNKTRPPEVSEEEEVVAPVVETKGGEESLGGELFEKASNPVADELPDTNVAPGTNPIEEVYNNPFE